MLKKLLISSIAVVCATGTATSQTLPSNLVTEIPEDKIVLSSAEALAADAIQYMEAYSVSFDEAIRRLSIMAGNLAEIESIESKEAGDFAGSYFEHGETFELVVQTTKIKDRKRRKISVSTMTPDQRRAQRLKERREARIEARRNERQDARREARQAERRAARQELRKTLRINDAQVARAEALLDTTLDIDIVEQGSAKASVEQLNAAAQSFFIKTLPGLQGTGVDVKTNEVIIILSAPLPETILSQIGQEIGVPFRVETSNIEPMAIYAGLKYKDQANLNYGSCMTSFTALTQQGTLGVLTADHCQANFVEDNGISKNMRVAPETTFSGREGDFKVITNDSTSFAPWFEYDGSRAIRTVDNVARRGDITAAGGLSNSDIGYKGTPLRRGSFLCHLGQDFHRSTTYVQSCGEVVTKSFNRFTDDQSTGNMVLMQNTGSGTRTAGSRTRGTLKCFNYDSGGPVFANNTAYGVVSSCGFYSNGDQNSTDRNVRARFLIFTPVDLIETEGVSIVTY